jgi:hypothetical protein
VAAVNVMIAAHVETTAARAGVVAVAAHAAIDFGAAKKFGDIHMKFRTRPRR